MIDKRKIFNKINESLDEKIHLLNEIIKETKLSRDNDTKSSAGDKYETGREMMQAEIIKTEVQLSNILDQKKDLAQINLEKRSKKVEFGSLVETNNGNYFFSIAFGKIEIEGVTCYSISLASPFGQMMNNKVVGDNYNFNGKQFVINNIE